MPKSRLIGEFFEYVKHNKKLWLIPLVIVLGLIGTVILVSQAPALAPFLYSLF